VRLCQAVQAEISPAMEKKDKSPVTIADFGSQALICRALEAAFPDDPIIAEEGSAELQLPENQPLLARVANHVQRLCPQSTAETACRWIDRGGARAYCPRFWTLDPIDGTKGFLRKEQYAIALALIVDGRVEVAALACPNLPLTADSSSTAGAVFYAVRGSGAFALPLEGDAAPQPVRVSRRQQASEVRFCESVESGHSAHDDAAEVAKLLGITASPARLDSQAKYAVVARGEADIYLRLPTRADYREKIWDHAAGHLIASEAGGTVTDVTGKPLNFSLGSELAANRGVVVTNGALHAAVLAALAAVGVK
jgi:3'(2'), 5'-bisphosphate nucleotidase